MSDWGIALIAAGAAIAGSITTGFFAWIAAHRQARAAEYAGHAQANALMATVTASLNEQRRTRLLDNRRQTYAQYLHALHEMTLIAEGSTPGSALETVRAQFLQARTLLELTGPALVVEAAHAYGATVVASLHADPSEIEALKERRDRQRGELIQAAVDALATELRPLS
ncbi:hypothetical protein ACU4GG_32035 [Streptomyces nojiriensis]